MLGAMYTGMHRIFGYQQLLQRGRAYADRYVIGGFLGRPPDGRARLPAFLEEARFGVPRCRAVPVQSGQGRRQDWGRECQ